MRRFHCIWALLVLLAPGTLAARQQPASTAAPATTGYTIFMRGVPVGREDVTVRPTPDGVTVTGQGRLSAPVNAIIRSAEFKYGRDWTAQSFTLDATIDGAPVSIQTTFKDGTATTAGSRGSDPISASHTVAADTVMLPNGIFAGYAAMSLRLADSKPGTELRAYVLPAVEITIRINAVRDEQIQVGATILNVRRFDLTIVNPSGEFPSTILASESGSLIRMNVAGLGIDMVRDDVAASTARTQVFSNPGDEPVTIPATGFNLGATLTRPKAVAARVPAVVLVSGAAVGDRDGFALGVPTLGQLAGTIADAGIMVVRYDKRGYGQSGGRSESATVADYADDVRTIVRWLANRKDVDPKRIALVGHSDGAWIALLTAARERRVAAVAAIAAPSTRGVELNLEQQQLALERSALAPEEREKRIALQKQIHSAVISGKGWDAIPLELRQQADTPWFQSFLAYDPAKVLEDVRQPLLFVHGAIDRQVPVAHAERIAELARTASDSKSVELVVVRGVNHLLVPAVTGEPSEYPTLASSSISPDVSSAITTWLTKTFAAIR